MFTCTVVHSPDSKDEACPWKANRKTFFGKIKEQIRPKKTKQSLVLSELRDEISHYEGTGDMGASIGMHQRT